MGNGTKRVLDYRSASEYTVCVIKNNRLTGRNTKNRFIETDHDAIPGDTFNLSSDRFCSESCHDIGGERGAGLSGNMLPPQISRLEFVPQAFIAESHDKLVLFDPLAKDVKPVG